MSVLSFPLPRVTDVCRPTDYFLRGSFIVPNSVVSIPIEIANFIIAKIFAHIDNITSQLSLS